MGWNYLIYAAIALVSAYIALRSIKPPRPSPRDLTVTGQGNTSTLPVVYGLRRTGGTAVFAETTGNSDEYLWLIIALSEGEIDAVEQLWLNDVPILDYNFLDSRSVDQEAWVNWNYSDTAPNGGTGSDGNPTPAGNAPIAAWIHLGADSQVANDYWVANAPGWTANHRLQGIAHVKFRIQRRWVRSRKTRDGNRIYKYWQFDGIPRIQADIRGRKVSDPRNPTADPAYSSNGALILRDYMTNTRFGKGIPAAAIDDPSFIRAANALDGVTDVQDRVSMGQPVRIINATYIAPDIQWLYFSNLPENAIVAPGANVSNAASGGGTAEGEVLFALKYPVGEESVFWVSVRNTVGKFTTGHTIHIGAEAFRVLQTNVIVDTGQSSWDNVASLAAASNVGLPFVSGKYQAVADIVRTEVAHHFDVGQIKNIDIEDTNLVDRLNRAEAIFTNPAKNWDGDSAFWPNPDSTEESDLLAQDNGLELNEEINLESCTSRPHAAEIARRTVLTSRQQHGNMVVVGDGDGIDITPGDLIEITHPVLGYNRKQWLVIEVGGEFGASREFYIREYSPTLYTFGGGTIDAYADNTDLDLDIEPPTGLTATQRSRENPDGSLFTAVDAAWTPLDSAAGGYEVRWRDADADDWSYLTTRGEGAQLTGIGAGRTLTWQLRSVSSIGNTSEWVNGPSITIQAYDGHITIYFQANQPSGGVRNDLWFETDDDHELHVHDGTTWVPAGSTDVDFAGFGGDDVVVTTRGFTIAFYAPSTFPPTDDSLPSGNLMPGYLWFATDRPGTSYRWNGSVWVIRSIGVSTGAPVGGQDGVGLETIYARTDGAALAANQQPLDTWGYKAYQGGTRNGVTWTSAPPDITGGQVRYSATREVHGVPMVGDAIPAPWETAFVVSSIEIPDVRERIYTIVPDIRTANNLPVAQRPNDAWTVGEVGTRGGLTWSRTPQTPTVANPIRVEAERPIPGDASAGDAVPSTSTWTIPRYDANLGATGTSFEFIFARTATASLAMTQAPDDAWGYRRPTVAGGLAWRNTSVGLTQDFPYLWFSLREVPAETAEGDPVTDTWAAPTIIGHFAAAGAPGTPGRPGIPGPPGEQGIQGPRGFAGRERSFGYLTVPHGTDPALLTGTFGFSVASTGTVRPTGGVVINNAQGVAIRHNWDDSFPGNIDQAANDYYEIWFQFDVATDIPPSGSPPRRIASSRISGPIEIHLDAGIPGGAGPPGRQGEDGEDGVGIVGLSLVRAIPGSPAQLMVQLTNRQIFIPFPLGPQGEKGDAGVGITSVEATGGHNAGDITTVTVTLTDGTTSEFSVAPGEDGDAGVGITSVEGPAQDPDAGDPYPITFNYTDGSSDTLNIPTPDAPTTLDPDDVVLKKFRETVVILPPQQANAVAIDLNQGSIFEGRVTGAGPFTINVANPVVGQSFTMLLQSDQVVQVPAPDVNNANRLITYGGEGQLQQGFNMVSVIVLGGTPHQYHANISHRN